MAESTGPKREISVRRPNLNAGGRLDINHIKAALVFHVEGLLESDTIHINFPRDRDDKLVLKINGHECFTQPIILHRQIEHIKCSREFTEHGGVITITVYRASNEKKWTEEPRIEGIE